MSVYLLLFYSLAGWANERNHGVFFLIIKSQIDTCENGNKKNFIFYFLLLSLSFENSFNIMVAVLPNIKTKQGVEYHHLTHNILKINIGDISILIPVSLCLSRCIPYSVKLNIKYNPTTTTSQINFFLHICLHSQAKWKLVETYYCVTDVNSLSLNLVSENNLFTKVLFSCATLFA